MKTLGRTPHTSVNRQKSWAVRYKLTVVSMLSPVKIVTGCARGRLLAGCPLSVQSAAPGVDWSLPPADVTGPAGSSSGAGEAAAAAERADRRVRGRLPPGVPTITVRDAITQLIDMLLRSLSPEEKQKRW